MDNNKKYKIIFSVVAVCVFVFAIVFTLVQKYENSQPLSQSVAKTAINSVCNDFNTNYTALKGVQDNNKPNVISPMADAGANKKSNLGIDISLYDNSLTLSQNNEYLSIMAKYGNMIMASVQATINSSGMELNTIYSSTGDRKNEQQLTELFTINLKIETTNKAVVVYMSYGLKTLSIERQNNIKIEILVDKETNNYTRVTITENDGLTGICACIELTKGTEGRSFDSIIKVTTIKNVGTLMIHFDNKNSKYIDIQAKHEEITNEEYNSIKEKYIERSGASEVGTTIKNVLNSKTTKELKDNLTAFFDYKA
ncbi:MAG: hypothetical protein RR334_01275 [Clostridia bacterium]